MTQSNSVGGAGGAVGGVGSSAIVGKRFVTTAMGFGSHSVSYRKESGKLVKWRRAKIEARPCYNKYSTCMHAHVFAPSLH